jgi:hypothetical protein
LIGGSYSAEDLALTAIKVGAAKIYISTRQEDSFVTCTNAWPGNKVDLLVGMQPVRVETRSTGNSILFAKVKMHHGEVFEVEHAIETCIDDVDTIIFCTGFNSSLEMLSKELQKPFLIEQNQLSYTLHVPKDWTMDETMLPCHLRNVDPGTCLWYGSNVIFPDLYKGTLIANPNMMYVLSEQSEFPILSSDTIAWFLASLCIGEFVLPPQREQRRLNMEQALYEMSKLPMYRFYMDSNFYNHVMSIRDDNPDEAHEKLWDRYENDVECYALSTYAQMMRDSKYPLDLGTYDQLNNTGKDLIRMDRLSSEHRLNVEKGTWRTFRDYNNAWEFRSIITGTVAVPLKKKWMDIDDANDLIVKVF